MRIVSHSESHLVKLSDGSAWQIFPGDLDATLNWLQDTELRLFEINDQIASHALISCDDGSRIRVRREGDRWPEAKVRDALKDG
jgi:hypothetical protein